MTRALLAVLLSACLPTNQTVVGENDGRSGGSPAGGATAGGGSAGGNTAGASTAGGDTAGGGSAGGAPSCADIDVQPLSIDFGRVAYFPAAPSPAAVTRRASIRNVGCEKLHLTRWTITAKNADSTAGELCVGAFDEQTHTCLASPPAGYDPAVGLAALAGHNELAFPIRVQPSAANKLLEWDVAFHSDDPDEPVVTVNVRAQSVTLPACNYVVEPPSLGFGLLQEPAGREISFVFRNLGQNPGDDCLISWLDVAPGGSPVFTLPSGPLSNVTVGPGQSLRVPVRAQPPSTAGSAVQTYAGGVDFYVSSPVNSWVVVPLTAQTGSGCLYVSPKAIDFGEVVLGCGTEVQRVSVFNLCAHPVTLQSPALTLLSDFPVVGAPPATLAPSSGGVLEMLYRPYGLGPVTRIRGLRATENGQTVDYIVPLTGTGVTTATRTETWAQPARLKADVLFIISNAPSMADDQAVISQLGGNFESLFHYAVAQAVDFQVGVLTTDVTSPDAGSFVVLRPTTPNLSASFASLLQVGTGGSATPQVAEVGLRALTPPLSNTVNAGFLRPDASLNIVAITDARDHSPLPGAYYEARLRELKPGGFISYSVLGPEWPAAGSCPTDDAWPLDSKLRWLTLAFPGSHASICAQPASWGAHLEQLGKEAFGYRTKFGLARQAQPATVSLSIDHAGQGFIAFPPMTPHGTTAWTYDPVSHSVVFEPLFVPEPGSTLEVQYTPVCH